MGIERLLGPVAVVSSIGSTGRGRPFSGESSLVAEGGEMAPSSREAPSSCLPAGLARAVPLRKGTEEYEDVVPTRSVLNMQGTVMRREVWAAWWQGRAVSRWDRRSEEAVSLPGPLPQQGGCQSAHFSRPRFPLQPILSLTGFWMAGRGSGARACGQSVCRASCLRRVREAVEMPWAAERARGRGCRGRMGTWALLLPSKWH